MVGSLLRCLYSYADDPEQIKSITQSTYATLFAAETNPSEMRTLVEQLIVDEHMHDFDKALEKLLEENQ
jgi:hypothetical protein